MDSRLSSYRPAKGTTLPWVIGIQLYVSEPELMAIRAAAERRNVRVDSLVAKLVEAVVRDGLIDAVLDDD